MSVKICACSCLFESNKELNELGSTAAAIQGTIGNVGANSLFAIGQSAGTGAAGLAVVNGVVQAGGAVAVGLSGGVAWVKSVL